MKCTINDLAIFGGSPVFSEPLHVGRPNIGDRTVLLQRFNEILDRRWFTNNGPCVQEFELRLAQMLGVKHCIAMCNATIALEIAARAFRLHGEVIVPAFTFIATAHSLQWQEITPVFCDVDPETHNIDPAAVERMITPRTTGIVGVHIWGRPCPTEALEDIARRRGLTLLFDAAHALACSCHGRMIGSFGDAEIFSFHATKFLNTFEGGAIATNNDDMADKMRLMRNFGFAGFDRVIYIGTNGKMNEFSAAMGLTSLESLNDVIEKNRRNYMLYRRYLTGVPGIKVIEYDTGERCNYQYMVVEVEETSAGLSRDAIVNVLAAEGVIARRYFAPGCHKMEPYASYFPHAEFLLPHTARLVRRVMALPTGPQIDERAIREVSQIIGFAVEHHHGIASRISGTSGREETRAVTCV